jgi:hypothetical protein
MSERSFNSDMHPGNLPSQRSSAFSRFEMCGTGGPEEGHGFRTIVESVTGDRQRFRRAFVELGQWRATSHSTSIGPST